MSTSLTPTNGSALMLDMVWKAMPMMPSICSSANELLKVVVEAKVWFDALTLPIVTTSVSTGPKALLLSASVIVASGQLKAICGPREPLQVMLKFLESDVADELRVASNRDF